jgi:hypothetical protein
MKAEYGGYLITWNDWEDFIISKDCIEVRRDVKTLFESQKWIDKQNKQKYKGVPVLYVFSPAHGMVSCIATSSGDSTKAWVDSGENRDLVLISSLVLDTQENREIIKKIAEKKREIIVLVNSTGRLTASMMMTEGEL